MRAIETIAVVGAGLMGHGIAQDFATAGFAVRLHDRAPGALERALANVRGNLDEMIEAGLLTAERAEAALARLRPCPDLAEAVAGADLVVEAVTEQLETKRRLYAEIEAHCPADAILASNTSSLMPSKLAVGSRRPERLLVAHYFNPPHLVPLVELVGGPRTDPAHLATLERLYRGMGKRPVVVRKETPGFIGNRLQAALLREALNLVEQGIATPEDVDTVVRSSFGRRLAVGGLFELRDLAGLEIVAAVAAELYPTLAAGTSVPAPLRERVERGDYGIKTGRGFYTWTPESAAALKRRLARALAEIARWDETRPADRPGVS